MKRVSRQLRIAVVGEPGCSALSALLSHQLGIPHIALQRRPARDRSQDTLAAEAAAAAAGDAWIIHGNDDVARQLVWPRATMIVWLDPRRPVVLAHALWRGAWRLLTRLLRIRGADAGVRIVTRRSMRHARRDVRAAVREHARRRVEYRSLLDARWVRLTTLSDARDWLRDVAR